MARHGRVDPRGKTSSVGTMAKETGSVGSTRNGATNLATVLIPRSTNCVVESSLLLGKAFALELLQLLGRLWKVQAPSSSNHVRVTIRPVPAMLRSQ